MFFTLERLSQQRFGLSSSFILLFMCVIAGTLQVSSNGRQLRWAIGAYSASLDNCVPLLTVPTRALCNRPSQQVHCCNSPPSGMLPKEESPILSGSMQCAEAALMSVQTVQVPPAPPPSISTRNHSPLSPPSPPPTLAGQFFSQLPFRLQPHRR